MRKSYLLQSLSWECYLVLVIVRQRLLTVFEVSNVPYIDPPTSLTNITAFSADITGGAWALGTPLNTPRYDGWLWDEGPGTYFGGTDGSNDASAPLINGPVITIISDFALTLSNFVAYDTDTVSPVDGPTATLNAVPIPPTVLLLGAGLVGLVGVRRRVKS